MSAGRRINTSSQEWGTPRKFVVAIKSFFGGSIQLDPCSNQYSIVNAVFEYCLPDSNGLKEPWDFETIFVNPPYGRNPKNKTTIKNWLQRCERAFIDHGSQVIALVPVATNTRHWKEHVFRSAQAVCFLSDTRLKFLVKGKKSKLGAPMACALIYWGSNFNKFKICFSDFGNVVNLNPHD